jgi:hypothetical protein
METLKLAIYVALVEVIMFFVITYIILKIELRKIKNAR